MKTVFVMVLLTVFVAAASAQEGKVIAELSAGAEKIVKNSPFAADAVSESVQVLSDGNRIVRSSTSKLYRNGEGRFRREMSSGAGSGLSPMYFGGSTTVFSTGPGITILDPVVGFRYSLDSHSKIATQTVLKTLPEIKLTGNYAAVADLKEKAVDLAKLNTELRLLKPAAAELAATHAATVSARAVGPGVVTFSKGPAQPKYETRSEKLGTQNIEGVEAEGNRTTTTIPAGAIGNERPIEIVYERWYSSELQLVILSKHSDPRFGDQTYKLTNIVRTEPDPSLFNVPTEYRKIGENGAVYRLSATKAEAERNATVKRASSVERTKP